MPKKTKCRLCEIRTSNAGVCTKCQQIYGVAYCTGFLAGYDYQTITGPVADTFSNGYEHGRIAAYRVNGFPGAV